MGLTVSTLTPAIEKAKNVATESYVDSTVTTASAALEAAYIEYNNTVKQALIDGEISDAESTAIAAAETKVNDAKTLLNATIVTASNTALSNANAYTNSAISGSGFVLPSGVAAAVNSNTTTINGSKITTGSIYAAQIAANTITSDKISTYNLTAANSTFQNSIITNATIANGAITNAKIGDAQITTAKIGDAQITNAKIGALSVDTFKIQDESVIVPRFVEGTSAILYYTPSSTHNALIIYSSPNVLESLYCYLNGSIVVVTRSSYYQKFTTFYAGNSYSIQAVTANSNGGDGLPSYYSTQVFMLGVKK